MGPVNVATLKKSMSQKLRMDGREYSRPGWYFITIGADYHRHYFGQVSGSEMRPNALGRLVEECWDRIPEHNEHIALGGRQVMPNHFHGLLRILRPGGKGLGEVMNTFKGAVTRQWRRLPTPVFSRYGEIERAMQVWAPNYYDVICFDADELAVREAYIRVNPRRWALRDVPVGIDGPLRYKGARELLAFPGKRMALRISRRAGDAEIAALQARLAGFDGLACSTFFSPGERACLHALQEGKARIIWVAPMAMPVAISQSWTAPFLENRALWASTCAADQTDATRASCEQANQWVERFCRK